MLLSIMAQVHNTYRIYRPSITTDSTVIKEGFTIVSSRLATGIPLPGFFNGFIAGLIVILFSQDGLYSTIAKIILAGFLTGIITISIIRDTNDILPFQFFFFITLVVLMLVCPSILITALVENLTNAIAGATIGACGRAVMAGFTSGATVTIIILLCDITVATTLVRVAENYIHILLIASVLFQGLFGIYNSLLILATTAIAYVGATMYIGMIGRTLGGSSEAIINNMVKTVSTTIAFGAFVGASIGTFTGIAIISGAIIGSMVGAIISENDELMISTSIDTDESLLLDSLILIEPHSKSIKLLGLIILTAHIILRPIANITINRINIGPGPGFILCRRTTVFRVVGAIIGAAIGACAGVIGGAFIGVIITGFTIGTLTGGGIIIFESLLSGFRQLEELSQSDDSTLKRIGAVIDTTVLFIFVGIIIIMIVTRVSYFIISALIGPYFSGIVIALCEAITGNFNIASSGITSGFLSGIIVGIYMHHTEAANEFEVCALGAIGAVTGFITVRVDDHEAIANALVTNFGGAALGAFSGLLGGALIVIAKVLVEMLIKTAGTKVGGLVVAITTLIGGLIGSIIGATFIGLLGIAFSAISIVTVDSG